jgi:hypothetical protein
MRWQIVDLRSVSQQEERMQVRKIASTRRPRRTVDIGVARAAPVQGLDALMRAVMQVT